MVTTLTVSDLNLALRKGYKFEGLLGEGAYAKVFSVTCIRPEKKNVRLACKYINQSQVPTEFVKKFLPRELSILLKIKHPNIIHIHSIFINNNKCFIFMRLAEAGDALSYILKMGELSEKHSRLWFHQLAQAVRYLHILGVVHRDIKLENVFLSMNMNVKLGDFGFAKYSINENGEFLMSDTFCGSQQYAAPEVIKGISYNPKLSDIWSMGCVLFAMLNKKLPFDNTDAARLYELQVNHRYKYRDNVLNVVSVDVKNLIFRMLEPNVNRRYDIEAVVQSDWLRDMPQSESQKLALESVHTKSYKQRKSMLDVTVSTLHRKGEVRHIIVLKEGSTELYNSSPNLAKFGTETKQKQQDPENHKIKFYTQIDEKKEERSFKHNSSDRKITRPFKYDS